MGAVNKKTAAMDASGKDLEYILPVPIPVI